MGKKMHGRSAPHKIVKVPIGTVVYRAEAPAPRRDDADAENTERSSSNSAPATLLKNVEEVQDSALFKEETAPLRSIEPMADLTADGQEFVLAKGGKGGKG